MKLVEWRPYKKGQFGYRDRGPQGECPVKTGAMLLQATELPEAGGLRSPSTFSGNRALPTHWFGISGLQDSGMINFCCSKSLFVLLCYSSPRKPIHLLIFPPLNSEIRICLTKVSPSHKQVVLWKFIVGTLRLEWSSPTENGSDFQACNNLSVKWTVLNK